MRVLIDACVLYPTVMREIVLGVAEAGVFTPLWSARILEEWALAATRLGNGQDVIARGEIAILQSKFPSAMVEENRELENQLYLPDINDRHVLASAITGQADVVMTLNLRDFPRRNLVEFDLSAIHPDALMRQFYDASPKAIQQVVQTVHENAERLSGETIPVRKLLKKARLPRLGKVIEQG